MVEDNVCKRAAKQLSIPASQLLNRKMRAMLGLAGEPLESLMLLFRGNPSVRSMQPPNNSTSLAASLVRGPLYPSQSGINISLHAEAGEKAYSKLERRVCPNGTRIGVVRCKQSDASCGLLLVSARDQLEVPRPVENLPEGKPAGA